MKYRGRELHAAHYWAISSAAAWCLLGCQVRDSGNPAYQDPACTTQSYRGYCLTPDRSEAIDWRVDAASDANTASDANDHPPSPVSEGQACAPENDETLCYEGPAATRAEGACISGVRKCVDGLWTECFGQVVPAAEKCNGRDDDCDGIVDEDMSGACVAAGTGCAGRFECRSGHLTCAALVDPRPETCNGLDDDCDGTIDEDSDQTCIEGNAGCRKDDFGFHCRGACATGVQRCRHGALEACTGQTKPAAKEQCQDRNDIGTDVYIGTDDDCDGEVDETCPCSGSAEQACYAASRDARTGAMCRPGSQQCNVDAGTWGACEGAGTPSPETCPPNGVDDDCDGVIDNVQGEGDPCVSSHLGSCHDGTQQCAGNQLRCMTPSARGETCNGFDDDCDGVTDNGFDLQGGRNNCGDCNTKCAEGSECCDGTCADLATSHDNCGECGSSCAKGATCCGDGNCPFLNSDRDNCGKCGHACAQTEQCCKGSCVDTLSDPMFCGACNIACEPDAPKCSEGNCVSM